MAADNNQSEFEIAVEQVKKYVDPCNPGILIPRMFVDYTVMVSTGSIICYNQPTEDWFRARGMIR